MGSKRLDKISDYSRHGYNLRATCKGCGHTTVIDALALSIGCSTSGQSRDMGAIQRRLRCRKCRGRDVICGPCERLPGER